ncbi:MAG: OmpH family outer membrane protein [Sphingopyxis sp.]
MTKTFMMMASAIALSVGTPALAQRAAAVAAPVVATADIDGAVQQSAAFAAAATQIQTTYAAQISNRTVRAQALQAELTTLRTAAIAEQQRTPQNAAALQAAITAFQTRQQAAEQELQTLSQPIDLAVAYVREQITLKLTDAVRAATTARRVDMLLNSEAIVWRADSADLTPAIVTELNRLVQNVAIVPPEGYQPGMLLRAQQANAATAPATPTPAAPQSR